MKKFLFNQPNALETLRFVKISLCCMIILLLSLGPYDSYYVDTADWLFKAKNPFPWFPNLGFHFWTLKYSVILFAVCAIFNFYSFLTVPLLASTFLFLNFYVTCFGTSYWITNTHLNFFSIALCFTPNSENPKSNERASYILAFIISYIAILYFQAGFSKLLLGGTSWFFEGERIRTETLLTGTNFGKSLLKHPWIFPLLGLGTGVFELFLPFLFFIEKTRKWAALSAIAFHLGTFTIMGISFWFLWALYPSVFFHQEMSTLFQNQDLYLNKFKNQFWTNAKAPGVDGS